MCQSNSNDDKSVDRDQNESDHSSEEDSFVSEEEEEEESMCIRAKWTIDGANTIDEAIEKLNDFIEYLRSLKEEGWKLREPIDDDYGFLYKTETN